MCGACRSTERPDWFAAGSGAGSRERQLARSDAARALRRLGGPARVRVTTPAGTQLFEVASATGRRTTAVDLTGAVEALARATGSDLDPLLPVASPDEVRGTPP